MHRLTGTDKYLLHRELCQNKLDSSTVSIEADTAVSTCQCQSDAVSRRQHERCCWEMKYPAMFHEHSSTHDIQHISLLHISTCESRLITDISQLLLKMWSRDKLLEHVKEERLLGFPGCGDVAQTLAIQITASSYAVAKRKVINKNWTMRLMANADQSHTKCAMQ